MCIEVRVGEAGSPSMLAICMLTKSIDSGYRESMVRMPRWMTALRLAEWASGAPFECAGKQAVWYPAQWP